MYLVPQNCTLKNACSDKFFMYLLSQLKEKKNIVYPQWPGDREVTHFGKQSCEKWDSLSPSRTPALLSATSSPAHPSPQNYNSLTITC